MTVFQIWDLWYPTSAAHTLSFARGRLDATAVLLVHAPPDALDVEVRDDDGARVAYGGGLHRTADRPMARLTVQGSHVTREDLWPEEVDLGRPVILPGGAVGILKHWWNADDGTEWRWRVEFCHRR